VIFLPLFQLLSTEQGYAYAKCLKDHSSENSFLGFIDTDEFLVINDPQVQHGVMNYYPWLVCVHA